ncbi:hypothetical protein [Natronosalvus caseinilyticus]|uniref:hypothetical protein n=1 Tax=Natronosalvus caseinilyticus TaxID=2953747 RepID=UPI0028B04DF9|nr:hypothetical protein [Natronosalvus caseinilyticus]
MPEFKPVADELLFAEVFAEEVDDRPFYADVFAEEVDLQIPEADAFEALVDDRPFYADAFAEAVDDQLSSVNEHDVDESSSRPSKRTGRVPYLDLSDAEVPWKGDQRAMKKTLLLKTAVLHPDRAAKGIPFSVLLDEVFGDEWETGDRNYHLLHDFIAQYPEYLEKSKLSGDFVWVRPAEKGVTLIRSIDELGNGDGGGVATTSRDSASSALPRERVERVLRSTRRIQTDPQRALLLRQLAEHGETMIDEKGEPKTIEPHGKPVEAVCRFTDSGEANRTRAVYECAADVLEEFYDYATWVTYTTPRECISSVYDSVRVIRETLTRLHRDRFTYDAQSRPRPGYTPDYVCVLEPHRDLVAHLHVVYGGEQQVMKPADLQADWHELLNAPAGKPAQVAVRSLSLEPSGWWVTDSEDHETDIRDYHRSELRNLARLASMTPQEIYGLADDLENGTRVSEGRDLAGLALPFATDTRFTSASKTLTQG